MPTEKSNPRVWEKKMPEKLSRRTVMELKLQELAREAIQELYVATMRITRHALVVTLISTIFVAFAHGFGMHISWTIHLIFVSLVAIGIAGIWTSYRHKLRRFSVGLFGQSKDEASRMGDALAKKQLEHNIQGPNSLEAKAERFAKVSALLLNPPESKAPPGQ